VRLVTYDAGLGAQAGVLVGEEIVPCSALDAPAGSVRGLLEAIEQPGLASLGERAVTALSERLALASVSLLAPVPNPEKIVCLGLNYSDHAVESAAHPEYVDYEAELAVVIGRAAHCVSSERALGCVAGAMPFNDVSARDLQLQNQLWTSGKAIDTFAPCGPALVTLDEIADIQDLGLRARINGEVLQEGNTREQIFGVAECVAWLSRTMTLLPGDIIATGTPAGVGASKGRFLRDGDTVEIEVDGLGSLSNRVRRE